jgi:integrase
MRTKRLNDRFIKSIKPTDKEQFFSDYDGLYLRVAPISDGGGKTWRFRHKPPGAKYPIKKGLGNKQKYPAFGLATARSEVRTINEQIALGIDPFRQRHKELEAASDFINAYAKLKGLTHNPKTMKGEKAYTDVVRNIGYLTENLGDHPPHDYSKLEINSFIRDRLKTITFKGTPVKTGSLRRELNSIQAVFNLVYEEHEIDHFHRFRKLKIPKEKEDKEDKEDFTSDQLNLLRGIIGGSENKIDQIIGLLIDTGMRSSEAVGLASEDIKLGTIPHIVLHKNPMRRLKNRSSQRIIPLVGSSLAVAHCLDLSDKWVFLKYLETENGKSSANASINNRLHIILGPESPTSHSFRHTLATRLRSVECPEYMRKELGGWASSVSEMYGTPTDITNKAGYIEMSLDWVTEVLE